MTVDFHGASKEDLRYNAEDDLARAYGVVVVDEATALKAITFSLSGLLSAVLSLQAMEQL